MGKRGPKAQTKVQQDLKGNPSNRPRPEPVPAEGEPNIPLWLTVDAMVIFNRIVGALPPGFFSEADGEVLGAYATAAIAARDAAIQFNNEGIVVEEEKYSKDGVYLGSVHKKHPAMSAWSDAVAKMATLGTRLGLDPAARQAIAMPPKGNDKPDNNGFGDLIGGKFTPKVVEGGKSA